MDKAARARVVGEIMLRRMTEHPDECQYEIRAHALKIGRERLRLSGSALAESLEREKALLAAAIDEAEGREVTLRSEVSERAALMSDATVISTAAVPGETSGRTLAGFYARWDTTAEILSAREGHFVERISRGAFADSIASGTVKSMFNHGKDATVGMRPIGRFTELRDDDIGGRFTLKVTPTTYSGDIVAMAQDGLLGTSVGFIVRDSRGERWTMPKGPSQSNPRALPERTIVSGDLFEISLTGMPAYQLGPLAVRARDVIPTSQPGGSDRVTTAARLAHAARRAQMFKRGIH